MNKPSKITLGNLINFQRGFDLPKSTFVNGEYPVISSNGILGYHNEFMVKGPGITIGRSGTVGLPHFIEINFYPHNTSLFIENFKGNDKKYIYYLLKNLGLNKQKSGSGVPTMNRNHLHPLVVLAYLEKEDQQKTAAVLSALDAKIELNKRINAELETMAKTLYDYWFLQFDFSDRNGKPYKSSGGKMVYNDTLLREIPAGWNNGSLNDLGQITGGSTPSTDNPANFTNKGTPWITPNDLSDNFGNKFITRGALDVTNEGIKDASLKKYPMGTVLLSSRAPIGYMAIAREGLTTNQGFKSFIPNKGYSSSFVYYSVKSSLKAITQNATGSTFKEISGTVLKTVKVCLPQSETVEQFSRKIEPIFKRQDLLEQENQQLTQLRDWLLPMLMNGQVTIK